MLCDGLILTGTSCAGKSTISEMLCTEFGDAPFRQVPAITTREKRKDDTSYEYVTDEQFNCLDTNGDLIVKTTYRNKKYGIKKNEYDNVKRDNKVPILIITPESASDLLKDNTKRFMCIFIDAPDQVLLDRQRNRKCEKIPKKIEDRIIKQNAEDRKYMDEAHYTINNADLDSSVNLVRMLWDYRDRGGMLPDNMIEAMIECGMLLRNADCSMIKGASYDLRLGDEYYYNGQIRVLTEKKPFLTIEPYDYAIVSCRETACIPRSIAAKFGLTVKLFCQGVILSNGPQIDPGFRGTLFCLLFNTSNRAVHLKRGQHYATIEFNKLADVARPYVGQYQDRERIIDYIPANSLHGAINELKKEIEQLKKESKFMQNIYLGVVGLMFAIISILLVIR